MAHRFRNQRSLAGILLLCVASLALLSGCQRQKGSDKVKTYTSDQKAPQGGGSGSGGSGSSGSSGGQSDAKPLDAPADTTTGKSSKDSDLGTSAATHGQVVSEPGAPVEHQARPAQSAPRPPAPSGH